MFPRQTFAILTPMQEKNKIIKGFPVLSSKYVYENKFITVKEDKVVRHNEAYTYLSVERDDAVVIIPITPSGKILFLKHYRYPVEQVTLELPMGGIDTGESPIEAAGRELREETGIGCTKMEEAGFFFPLSALTSQKVHVVTAILSEEDINKAVLNPHEDEILGIQFIDKNKIKMEEILCGLTLAALTRF